MAISSRVTKQISSPVTKRNPRPRKYASQADRQAAYRARNVMLEFRAEPKTADNITRIADTLGYPRSDVLLSMVKFALTNHDWARFGLTHKTIPTYKENPTMKPASPAQLAARKRFAEMARSGAFKKATKRKANPGTSDATLANWIDRIASGKTYSEAKLKEALQHPGITAEDKIVIRAALKGAPYSHTDLQQAAINIRGKHKANPISGSNAGEFAMTVNGKTVHRFFIHTSDPWAKSHGFDYQLVSNVTKHGAFVKFTKTRAIVAVDEAADGSPVTEKWEIRNLIFYKTNPAKKTVSQKISQLVHEGYPQRQAVAVALSEQRAGKVKRNPMEGEQHLFGNKYATIRKDADNRFVAQIYEKVKTGIGEEIDFWGVKYYKTHAGAQRYLDSLKPMQKNPQKRNPAKVKYRNLATNLKGDQRVGYSVHMADRPSYQAIAWFSKKADAMEVAQEAADRTGKQLAVTRVQNYFGAM